MKFIFLFWEGVKFFSWSNIHLLDGLWATCTNWLNENLFDNLLKAKAEVLQANLSTDPKIYAMLRHPKYTLEQSSFCHVHVYSEVLSMLYSASYYQKTDNLHSHELLIGYVSVMGECMLVLLKTMPKRNGVENSFAYAGTIQC